MDVSFRIVTSHVHHQQPKKTIRRVSHLIEKPYSFRQWLAHCTARLSELFIVMSCPTAKVSFRCRRHLQIARGCKNIPLCLELLPRTKRKYYFKGAKGTFFLSSLSLPLSRPRTPARSSIECVVAEIGPPFCWIFLVGHTSRL
ncbi:hypothetical protein GWI33_006168 [Rhynchophorus ferrugineus]|uniref:Uncharacterized protein n=1 Tax=Rhynchophorus ferrugineus TaxID=354439 RepID=A0A834IUI2_RHYFE|nr:hypothetical protein GWI33_006168 [Rhynchophorus ferrugineus]